MPEATVFGMPWNWMSFIWGGAVAVVALLSLDWWMASQEDDDDDDLCGG
ncbi:hypothetical protein [Cupriavidus metallidurans]|nr:hypothetical protein [Cupriavidus metallidurans]UBM12772.1 hypothetical protein LAI70_27860 [Cupriavidus metallidurans]